MPKLVLAAKSTADRNNLTPSAERLVNCYAYPAPEGAKAPLVIRSCLGLREWATAPGPFLRDMVRVEGQLYVLAAGSLLRVERGGAVTFLAPVPDDPNATMCGHRDAVTIVSDGNYYVWNGALVTPTGNAFDSFGSVIFLDQFTIFSEKDGRRIGWCEVGDPTALNGLYFATAEARDDKIVRLVDVPGGYFAVLKEHSVEIWGNTGLGGFNAFRRIDGTVLDRGVKAFKLVARTPDGVFYIGEDDVAYQVTGAGSPVPISPPNVNQALKSGTPTHCLYYEDRGHQMHAIRFADRPAWCRDGATGYWHERAAGADHKPFGAVASAFCYGEWLLGDRLGGVYKLGQAPYDGMAPMRRTIRSRNLYVEGKRFSVSELEVEGLFGKYEVEETAPNWETDENGFPILDEDGNYILAEVQGAVEYLKRPGKIELSLSRDGGHTFGPPKVRAIGKVGQYRAKAEWHALGQFEDMVAELSMTDPVDVPILSEANVRVS